MNGAHEVRWSVDSQAGTGPEGDHLLKARATIPLRIDEVFSFFAGAENLARITPPELHFRILTSLPIEMQVGTRIVYRLRLGPFPFSWRTEITEWDPPNAFTDIQLRGPYQTWIHRHLFQARDGGTLMTDEVRYRLPLGHLGNLALPLVSRELLRIFSYRQRKIAQLLVP